MISSRLRSQSLSCFPLSLYLPLFLCLLTSINSTQFSLLLFFSSCHLSSLSFDHPLHCILFLFRSMDLTAVPSPWRATNTCTLIQDPSLQHARKHPSSVVDFSCHTTSCRYTLLCACVCCPLCAAGEGRAHVLLSYILHRTVPHAQWEINWFPSAPFPLPYLLHTLHNYLLLLHCILFIIFSSDYFRWIPLMRM